MSLSWHSSDSDLRAQIRPTSFMSAFHSYNTIHPKRSTCLILFQSHQRLPSYEEAVHRDQIPDLLQDKHSFRTHHDDQRDDFTHRKYNSREKIGSSQLNGSFDRDKGVKRSHGSQSSANTSLEREPPQQQEYRLSDSPDHSPLSSLERSLERTDEYDRQLSHRSSSGSSYSSSHVPPVQTPIFSRYQRSGLGKAL